MSSKYPTIRIGQDSYEKLLAIQKACSKCRSFVDAVRHVLHENNGKIPHKESKK